MLFDPLYLAVSAVMWAWHQAFGALLGPSSGAAWALSVVFLVLTLRALMIRPFVASVRSGHRMRAIAPQLRELRERHRDDPARLARETRALQGAHGVSALGGCLPALLQAPVFLGLLHVLHGFNQAGGAGGNYAFAPAQVASFLDARLFGAPLSAYLSMPQDLLDSFGAPVQRWEVAAVTVPLMLLAAVATYVTARHSLAHNTVEGPAAAVLRWTPWIFPLGAVVGGLFFPFPVAILLYWLSNNAWTLAQQRLVHRRVQAEPPAVAAPAPPPAPVPRPRPARPRQHASGHRPSRRRR